MKNNENQKKPTQDFCLILCVDHLRRDFYTFYAGFHGQKTTNQAGAHGKIVPRTLNLRRSTLNLLDSPFYHVSVRTHTSGRWKTRKNMLLSTIVTVVWLDRRRFDAMPVGYGSAKLALALKWFAEQKLATKPWQAQKIARGMMLRFSKKNVWPT